MPGGLQIWAYFSRSGRHIAPWATCYEDQGQEFRENNYTLHRVGVWALLDLAEGRQRLFYVPSSQCYKRGEELVEAVVEVLVHLRGSLEEVWAEYCWEEEPDSKSSADFWLQALCDEVGLEELECDHDVLLLLLYVLLFLGVLNCLVLCCVLNSSISSFAARLRCYCGIVTPTVSTSPRLVKVAQVNLNKP